MSAAAAAVVEEARSERVAVLPPGDLKGRRSFDGWALAEACRTPRAYTVAGVWDSHRFHTDRRSSGLRSGPHDTPTTPTTSSAETDATAVLAAIEWHYPSARGITPNNPLQQTGAACALFEYCPLSGPGC